MEDSPKKGFACFNIVEAKISDFKKALDSGLLTSVELLILHLQRIGTYDLAGLQLNAFTTFNPSMFDEARASDAHRASGQKPRLLEGIPYTIKDGYKYLGMNVAAGSPAFENLMSSEDAFVAAKLKEAGAIMIGKTNMPPMAAGGMQRGLYGRAESPYNKEYLTAAFSSGSSNGAATCTAASFAAFGLGSETVSSGRSPGSNNGLVTYTPSRGVISCKGLWPLYVTCDVVVPYTRCISDMCDILQVLTIPAPMGKGDFWKEQSFVKLPETSFNWAEVKPRSLKGKRIGVPRMYVGGESKKPIVVSEGVISLWERTRRDLESLGAEIILTDFPLVENYEDDSISLEPNNIKGAPSDWNKLERGLIIAKAWDKFLKENNHPGLHEIDGNKLFPKPPGYLPDTFFEIKNAIDYVGLPKLSEAPGSLFDIPGMSDALQSLEAQRKRDFEDWLDDQKLDFVVFPANGDIGKAGLETDLESARHALQNGIKYSNGNRAIRHLGVPTVSVCMGLLEDIGMPVNLTFAGKAYTDDNLMEYAYTFEEKTKRRRAPRVSFEVKGGKIPVENESTIFKTGNPSVFVNGSRQEVGSEKDKFDIPILEKLPVPKGRAVPQKNMVLVIRSREDGHLDAKVKFT
ncbi:amidase signature domain-containing protein [Tricladium varicosporioides]|nr:amidase signature domain-containing protein [Hymenoscyphus varicosporioides]